MMLAAVLINLFQIERGISQMWVQARMLKELAATEGVMLSAKVVRMVREEDPDAFKPVVRYRYMVDGREHYGIKISIIEPGPTADDWAEKFVAVHQPGTKVRVHYLPGQPGRSYLDPAVSYWPHVMAVYAAVSLVMLCAAALLYRNGIRIRGALLGFAGIVGIIYMAIPLALGHVSGAAHMGYVTVSSLATLIAIYTLQDNGEADD